VSERTREDIADFSSALSAANGAVSCLPPAAANDMYLCYDTRENCESGARPNTCVDSGRPRWHCGRTTDQASGERHTDICWPTKAMCEASHHPATETGNVGQPCRAVASVYCRNMEGRAIACHPNRDHCEQIQRHLREQLGRETSACVRR
jgi:hypothetical protein